MTFKLEALEKRHDRRAFACGEPALDRYFREQVTQDIKRRVTSCFVAVQGEAIAGFYTIASASIPVKDWPEHLRSFRKKHKLSQVKLADLLQISRRNVEDWERGIHKPPEYLKRALDRLIVPKTFPDT